MFLVYINDLLGELCKTENGLFLGKTHIPGILLADDTALISNSPGSLQCLLNHVEKYACTWRLHYNPCKSVSIVFNKSHTSSLSYNITLFGNEIPQSDDIVYAGCLLQGNLKSDKLTERVYKAARSKIHSLYSIGVNNSDIHPVVSTKIWKRIVLPSAFYSCEIWPSITLTDMQQLEYLQRHFSRIIQGFSKFSPSLSSISNVGLWTIQGYIDKCRLLFLGRLHRSDQASMHYRIYRLIADSGISEKFCSTKLMLETAEKYQVIHLFQNNSPVVFNKNEFSRTVTNAICASEERKWFTSLSADTDMYFFRKIHTKLRPNRLWKIVKDEPSTRLMINFLVQVSSMKIISKLCTLCNKNTHNYNMHLLLSCFELLEDREVMLENILEILNVEEYVLFEDQSHEQKFLSLSGCVEGTSFENISYTKWKYIMINVANTLYKNRVHYVTDCRFL
jgi:hypothetical protein